MKLNRTTLRTVDILKMVSKKPDGITLDEICEKLELPKTSAYDIITTLAHTGMVHVVKGQKQRYTIGLTAYRVGINYTNNLDFIGTIDPVLKAFAKEMGKTVFFGVRSDDSIVYICKFEPENPIITTATVGTKNPLYCTSLGKAIMANMEQEERDALADRINFRPHTRRTIQDKVHFLEVAFRFTFCKAKTNSVENIRSTFSPAKDISVAFAQGNNLSCTSITSLVAFKASPLLST